MKKQGSVDWLTAVAVGSVMLGAAVYLFSGWLSERAVESRVGEQLVERLRTPHPRSDSRNAWRTNWRKSAIDPLELRSGGPPRDGIPPIDAPEFGVAEEVTWCAEDEPVLLVEWGDVARIYPLQILMFHEIVNDTLAGQPICVTYCPLCNAAIAFDRRIDGRVLDFGTSGMLRHSDLVMWDRQTESLWQQITGECLVGDFVGHTLATIPLQMLSYSSALSQAPQARVLQRPALGRDYGRNPYVGYDHMNRPFLYQGEIPQGLRATDRVVGLPGDPPKAWSLTYVETQGLVQAQVDGYPTLIVYEPGMRSALDRRQIRDGRSIGSVRVLSRRVGERTLDFERTKTGLHDKQTNSTWEFSGVATAGAMKGTRLRAITHFVHFWFAWRAFFENAVLLPSGNTQGDGKQAAGAEP